MVKSIIQKKSIYYPLLGLAILLMCYFCTFHKTIQAWQSNHSLNAQFSTVANVSYTPAYSHRELKHLNTLIQNFEADTDDFRNIVINHIGDLADSNKVKLTVMPSSIFETRDTLTHLNQLTFAGSYNHLIRLLNGLESANNTGYIRSVNIQQIRAPSSQSATKDLSMQIVFVNLDQ